MNFTWSFYGNLLYLLPLSILGLEEVTTQNRYISCCDSLNTISIFIFSYYQAIIIGCYFIYIDSFSLTNMTLSLEHQKLICVISATVLVCLSSVFGLFTGISAFLENDRKQIPMLIYHLTPLDYHYFSLAMDFIFEFNSYYRCIIVIELYRFYFL
ncbi:YfhO family protein [Staphylococcus aureus]